MFASKKIETLKAQQRYRTPSTTHRQGATLVEKQGKRYISFSCNDYFGLTHHPKVIEASINATKCYGTGAAASRYITGNHPLYAELEASLAQYKHTKSALVFGSGYLANIGIIPTLASKGDLILVDKHAHACILDGILISGAHYKRFTHNSPEHLEHLLKKYRAQNARCLIITETIFSMDGDRAPLEPIAELAALHNALFIVDDAHGIGLLEPSLLPDITVGTLSKGLGAYGGYVCTSAEHAEYIQNTARSAIFSTALPPSTIATAHAALTILQENPELQHAPLKKAQHFTTLLDLPPAESAIVPVILGDEVAALKASAALEEAGFLVAAIRPPTVPAGTARLRLAFSAAHEEEDITRLAVCIKDLGIRNARRHA